MNNFSKPVLFCFSILFLVFCCKAGAHAQGVTIGSNNPPDPSAALDVQSVTGGFAAPRLTTAQRNAIPNPMVGLQIYNTDNDCMEMFFSSGGWKSVQCGCTAFPNAQFAVPSASVNNPATFSTPVPNMIYQWTFQNGFPATSFNPSEQVVWSSPGKYEVTLTLTDSALCSATYKDSITVSLCQPYTHVFTNCGQLGNTGPSQSLCNTAYGSGVVTVTGGIQYWTVPYTGTYRITAKGAQGAPVTSSTGGLGASMSGDFLLNAGEVLKILVGQQGEHSVSRLYLSSPGGGGSFVVNNTNGQILIVAGGGGGTGNERPALANATTSTTANASSTSGTGGSGGNGGTSGTGSAGAGGGYYTDGTESGNSGGYAFVNGGNGGVVNATYAPMGGGFGGGGSPISGGNSRYGGGGGYSGGGGSASLSGATTGLWGGGGGSVNNGSNQLNQGGVNQGQGEVIITRICP